MALHGEHLNVIDDNSALPFLPMLYVAWADGDLSRDEMGEICRLLDGDCGHRLGVWLDADQPPTARDLARLLARLRKASAGLERREKMSLTGLGLALARLSGQVVQDAERNALAQIEDALGIADSEAARQLLASRRPPPALRPVQPSFDVDAMKARLDGAHGALRERIRQLLSEPEFKPPIGVSKETARQWTLERCRRLADEGLGALSFPVEAGGAGDIGQFVVAFETLALGDLSLLVKFGVQFGLFGGSILNLGTPPQHERYLADVGSMELPGCFAMTETGHGSNVQDLETVARYESSEDCFILQTPHDGARKDYIGNAALHGELATVFAQLEVGEESHGVHAFLVPIRDAAGQPLEGVRIEDCGEKLGLNGVDNGRLWFSAVKVPRGALLDRFASVDAEGVYDSPIASPNKRFFTMLGTLVGGRVSVACGALSASKTALRIAVGYGEARRQFGDADAPETKLLDYQTHQRRLLPRLAKTYALHFALRHLRRRFVEGTSDEDRRQVEGLAAGLKAYSTWHATDTIQTCRECCGGQGYLAVNRFAALKADTDVFSTFEGDNVVLLQLVAKGLLSGYKKQFSRMGLSGLVRFVAAKAATAVSELNPVITRRRDEEHLRSADFHSAALRWREQHLLSSVARRLKRRLDAKVPMAEAMIEVQTQLVEAATAHVESLVHTHFLAAVTAETTPDLRDMLEKLRQLFALDLLERHRGWFLEHGYFEPSKSRALRPLVNALCLEIRPQALPLVRALGVPEALLKGTIGI